MSDREPMTEGYISVIAKLLELRGWVIAVPDGENERPAYAVAGPPEVVDELTSALKRASVLGWVDPAALAALGTPVEVCDE